MLINTIKLLITKDLRKLHEEIELYKNEASIWKVEGNIANSGGNLCLHLIGNLNTYIGQQIGKTGYIRNRELEFSLKHVPREELLRKIDETINVVNNSLDKLDEAALPAEFPMLVFEENTSTEY